jgi:SEC-C motif-containing protein
MAKKKSRLCPCGSAQKYNQCCGRYIEAGEIPATPEQLMRSRYTAYTLEDDSYILDSWHSSTRPASLSEENKLPVKWVELKVIDSSVPAQNETIATVEFVARFKVKGKAEQMHECSEFIKAAGRWFYLKGKVE